MSSDVGSLNMPNRSLKMLPLSEKVQLNPLIREERKACAKVAEICGKNKSVHETVKMKTEIHASFAVAPQTANNTTTVPATCLVKVEKSLNVCVCECV